MVCVVLNKQHILVEVFTESELGVQSLHDSNGISKIFSVFLAHYLKLRNVEGESLPVSIVYSLRVNFLSKELVLGLVV